MRSGFFLTAGLIILFVLVGCAGCISAPGSTGPDRYDLGNGQQVAVLFSGQDSDWSFARGCTWTATYQVSNVGVVPAGPLQVNIESGKRRFRGGEGQPDYICREPFTG